MDGSLMFLGARGTRFSAASAGTPILARPFFNADPAVNAEDAELVANPALLGLPPLAGRVDVRLASELYGADINGICNVDRRCWCRTDFLFGFHYLNFHEALDITEHLFSPPPLGNGMTIALNDHFATRNQFFGGQVGFRSEVNWRRWQVDLTSKVGIGGTHEQVDINGMTIITPAGMASQAFSGGLLTQPTNIGHYNRNKFSVISETGVNLGYQITDHWRAYAGYSFLYWSNVARPADQIDRVVNGTLLPPRTAVTGPARPQFIFKDRDFWAHGVDFGLEFRY
jgi:hypothetical protein